MCVGLPFCFTRPPAETRLTVYRRLDIRVHLLLVGTSKNVDLRGEVTPKKFEVMRSFIASNVIGSFPGRSYYTLLDNDFNYRFANANVWFEHPAVFVKYPTIKPVLFFEIFIVL